MIRLKRAYEPAKPSDGYRVLVERLWPRGLRKEDARLDAWLKDIAPSNELRTWFGHDPKRWREFRARYKRELHTEPAAALLDELTRRAARNTVTLVFSTHDEQQSNATILKELVERRLSRAAPAAKRPAARATRNGRASASAR
ncbi:MAG TPA: DUF488 domain-containing protein [Polyangiaceae bacterium]|nr:DUF488 domain-containing protein [Polyangiaceae bacterium]